MLYYGGIDVSERIDINKTSTSKESNICHYCYFLDKRFKFPPDVWNGCDDVLMMSMNRSNIAILNIHDADYCCIIIGINKNELIKLIQSIDLSKKSRIL